MIQKDKPIILLVDDAVNDVKLMQLAFQKAEFINPLQSVKDGAEAISYLKGDAPYGDRNQFPLPTVMLLDLNMPRKNGFEVLDWVRHQPLLKRLPVIILTASSRIDDIERAYDLGANAFLVKPVILDELTRMTRCLRDWIALNQFAPWG
jgi:CheY-like chemotaxis protein